MPEGEKSKELVLPLSTYAYILDETNGQVSAAVGPYKASLGNTDQLVTWDPATRRFKNVDNAQTAQQSFVVAEQGEYIVLVNPAPDGAHPLPGKSNIAQTLESGNRVMIAGPVAFPLWPGQIAQVIPGHHLRHNQYVIVRVYDADLARENWGQAVIAPQAPQDTRTDAEKETEVQRLIAAGHTETEAREEVAHPDPTMLPVVQPTSDRQFTMGQLRVIPGTEVSFYMPSTGTEVVPEGGTVTNNINTGGTFVRDAVTLETLEYCVLIDENGQKRYERGPQVIFPKPTETFKRNDNNSRVFDAIELNEQTGLYVKNIEDWTDDEGVVHKAGFEEFITGKDTPIYFPRAESTIIQYGDKRKHHAIAVPAGEGRYVLDRRRGAVDLHTGPTMLLPDPRWEVIVRRILAQHDVQTMFPGNLEAASVNQQYADEQELSGGYLENAESRRLSGTRAGTRARYAGNESPVLASASVSQNFTDDSIKRGTSYSPPRMITLDTKYEGAVAISPFPGYAVLVVDKSGNRRVEEGPKVILLGYDETIMALSLSTGRPKSDAHLLKTGYLRTVNNVVSDRVDVETRDLVNISVDVSYRVNFLGETPEEKERWFSIENYVQVLTEHCRSILRNVAKQRDVLDFYTNAIDIIRDTLLGAAVEGETRSGMTFEENGMHVYDVEVLGLKIQDNGVEDLLIQAQQAALTGAIEVSIAEEAVARETKLQGFARETLGEVEKTLEAERAVATAALKAQINQALTKLAGDLDQRNARLAIEAADRENVRLDAVQGETLQQARDDREVVRFREETEQMVQRAAAFSPELIAALETYGKTELVERIVHDLGPAALASGQTTADILTQLFKGTAMEGIVGAFAERPVAAHAASQG